MILAAIGDRAQSRARTVSDSSRNPRVASRKDTPPRQWTCGGSPSGPTALRLTRSSRCNPELRRWTTPVQTSGYDLKVPAGKAEAVLASARRAPATDLASLNYYIVREGRHAAALIARKLHVNKADLADASFLERDVARVRRPEARRAGGSLHCRRLAPIAQSGHLEARRTVTQSGELARASATRNRVKAIYEVKRGDTLASIAKVLLRRPWRRSRRGIREWPLAIASAGPGQRLTVYRLAN